jgi:hypothetical protein
MPVATTETEIFELVFGRHRLDERGYPLDMTPEDEKQIYVVKKNIIAVHRSSDDSVVAQIEVVAPGNKSSPTAVRRFLDGVTNALHSGVHLLLIDILPPTAYDPNGLHHAIWSALCRDSTIPPDATCRIAASYVADHPFRSHVKQLTVGGQLPAMPLFLSQFHSVEVPVEDTYAWSFSGMAKRSHQLLESNN